MSKAVTTAATVAETWKPNGVQSSQNATYDVPTRTMLDKKGTVIKRCIDCSHWNGNVEACVSGDTNELMASSKRSGASAPRSVTIATPKATAIATAAKPSRSTMTVVRKVASQPPRAAARVIDT